MSDDALRDLAREAGIEAEWQDVHGRAQTVAPDALRALLHALRLPDDVEEARQVLRAAAEALPPLLTLPCGPDGVHVPGARVHDRFRLDLEGGGHREGHLEQGWGGEPRLPALDLPGYHRLTLDVGHTVVAAAPSACFSLAQAGAAQHQGRAPWAVAAQVYSLRRRGDLGIGDFGSVAQLAHAVGRRGAAALAISPVHALFSADVTKYGPYAPSTRLFLNVLHADPEAALGRLPAAPPDAAEFIDWPTLAQEKIARLRALFDQAADHPDFVEFRSNAGPALEQHARFEALHAWRYGEDPAQWHWRDWPADYANPDAPGVVRFARERPGEIAFHAFCQWLADASRARAQKTARDSGMPIGLITDLAVGTDGGGSHAWSRQQEILPGMTVGAPPDVFSPLGQDWGLTAFSPLQLRAAGYGAFIELLRAAFRHSGGIRVDHAMGLQRLWLVPQGGGPADGAYLRYPTQDMLRLLALESHRHKAIVIGEDLGTVPEGFNARMAQAGILGMRVLWFEQEKDGSFRDPALWSTDAAAMTTTHDLPTVMGWWQGRDIEWREKLGRFPDHATAERERTQRDADKRALWTAMLESGTATGDQPADPAPVLDAALRHVGSAACALAILPLEDALGLEEQPNLPGTTEGHPNWQRRLPGDAAEILDRPEVSRRLEAFALARPRSQE